MLRIWKKYKLRIFVIAILIIVIGIPCGYLYLLNNGNPYNRYIVNKYIPSYIEKKGYSKEDIKEQDYVEPKHLINKDYFHGHYMVIFKDEPQITYYYGVSKKGRHVKQFCEKDESLANSTIDINEKMTKHSEMNCVRSLDNRD
ncbi:hypothetical protein J6TS2_38570 [Heyndrickxia sporothermodurans]|nr:hypothetical protein J6TS2_38570 [Heyndrickxia sporothermodurans]